MKKKIYDWRDTEPIPLDELKEIQRNLNEVIKDAQDEALKISKSSIKEENRCMLRLTLQKMQFFNRCFEYPAVLGERLTIEEVHEGLVGQFRKLRESGIRMSAGTEKDEWFEAISRLDKAIENDRLPKGKYQRIEIAKKCKTFILRSERPSSKKLLAEVNKYLGKKISKSQLSEELDDMGLESFIIQGKRGRKNKGG